MWVNFRISSYKRSFFSIKFNSVGVSLSQGLHILFMTQTDDGTPKTSVPKHFDTHLDTLKIGLSPAKIENHVRDRALPSWKFSRRLARDICPGEYFSFQGTPLPRGATVPCCIFLESSRRSDVTTHLTCNAATYRFRDIRGQNLFFGGHLWVDPLRYPSPYKTHKISSNLISDKTLYYGFHDIIRRQITQKRYQIELFTMADQQKVVYGLSNGAVFNDLEQPLTQFSRLRYTLTLNIS